MSTASHPAALHNDNREHRLAADRAARAAHTRQALWMLPPTAFVAGLITNLPWPIMLAGALAAAGLVWFGLARLIARHLHAERAESDGPAACAELDEAELAMPWALHIWCA